MDGESLVTLIGIVPGPDCLKDLIPKIGLRQKFIIVFMMKKLTK